ncbi:DUF5133 domain-containing protein [Streptomyces avidinii]|uniref:DUF5133 domain-containing protein n=1 Tax=Streptomyces avidinii TaxID=1895 RepID=A0ABS4KY63_STRAV|nr:DUF5133 domain-containing protein [Streptomyces avidinii]MBP2034962.1 hypothetical protein [Streptomyces avidinii]GGY90095.1 hypothetical protein GCM10010343_14420 [Streptomyces avidinii]
MSADVLTPGRLQKGRTTHAGTPPEPAQSWAVGMLMATVPTSAHLAQEALRAAAAHADLPVAAMAEAMVAGSRGVPVPAEVQKALDDAVRAAQRRAAQSRRSGPFLMPTRTDAERALGKFFDARIRLRAAPDDPDARRAVDDAIYTLCVLMGQPSPNAAVHEALQYTEG